MNEDHEAQDAPVDMRDIKARALELRCILKAIMLVTSDPAITALAKESRAINDEILNELDPM